MTVNSVTKSYVKISSHNSRETYHYGFKGPYNCSVLKKFAKCGDQYLEISTEFSQINNYYLCI